MRVVAIDWSGAAQGAQQAIWRAVVQDGSLVELANGLNRDEVVEWLIAQVEDESNVVAGLDFAFSFPEWFCHAHGATDGPTVWRLAAEEGERWLAECPEPFWGPPGFRRPDLGTRSHFRRTEQGIRDAGHGLPKSVFQIGGAGAVGTGSIRGMPQARPSRPLASDYKNGSLFWVSVRPAGARVPHLPGEEIRAALEPPAGRNLSVSGLRRVVNPRGSQAQASWHRRGARASHTPTSRPRARAAARGDRGVVGTGLAAPTFA